MSSTKLGTEAHFPPLPGRPYPPARNHPRWKEIYRLHDEWISKYWYFSSDKKRTRLPFMNLAGYSTWGAPTADFDRIVWGARLIGIIFFADDYLDSGNMMDRIPGFKKVATGTGPLHPEDRAEICLDIAFRAIKTTSNPRTFDQLTKCTHEWLDSHVHDPYRDLVHYQAHRRIVVGIYWANAVFRYAMDINLADEHLNHPLMREAEGIVCDHISLVNDFFSYAKEKMTNSDDTNVIRILQENEVLTYGQAKDRVEKMIRQKEKDFIPAALAVLNDPELGKDPEVYRWIACMPSIMGGNIAWSQETGRYNVGDIPGGISFPCLNYEIEATPVGEEVDDTQESLLRDRIFNVKDIPPPDFTIDFVPIESSASTPMDSQPGFITSLYLSDNPRSRPRDVGILAVEVYIPVRSAPNGATFTELAQGSPANKDSQNDDHSIASTSVSLLLEKYAIDPLSIGRIEVVTEIILDNFPTLKMVLTQLFEESNIEICESRNGSAAALFNAVNWIESSLWDGRNVIIFAGDAATLVGPSAPIVIEPIRGTFTRNDSNSHISNSHSQSVDAYVTTLTRAYSSYKRKKSQALTEYMSEASMAMRGGGGGSAAGGSADGVHTMVDRDTDGNGGHSDAISVVVNPEFDYMVYEGSREEILRLAHAGTHYHDYLTRPGANIYSSISCLMKELTQDAPFTDEISSEFVQFSAGDYKTRVAPSLTFSRHCGNTGVASLFGALASIIDFVPGYDLFERRISMFAYALEATSYFFVLRIKGDTKFNRETLNLSARTKVCK